MRPDFAVFRLSGGFADNYGAGVPPAQDVVVELGRRDTRTTNLAESQVFIIDILYKICKNG